MTMSPGFLHTLMDLRTLFVAVEIDVTVWSGSHGVRTSETRFSRLSAR